MTSTDPAPTQRPAGAGAAGRTLAVDRPFTIDDLYALRAEVAAHAADLGATEAQLDRMLIVAGELATNAIRHADGRGRLRLWREGTTLHCQVSDHGPGIDDPESRIATPPDPYAPNGRGLWMCHRFADHLDIDTGPGGTTVSVAITLEVGAA